MALNDDGKMSADNSGATPSGKALAMNSQIEDRGVVRDEVDEQLLPLFLEEANELYPRICQTLAAWREQAGNDAAQRNKLQRALHTFKGSARMAGAMRLGELAHRIEGCIAHAVAQGRFDAGLWEELDQYLLRIDAAIEELSGGEVAEGLMDEVASSATRPPRDVESGQGVRFGSISERLYRVVRQTAKELGKRVNLELAGTEIRLESGVLERMTAPIEHLLRNAIAHGIEIPEQRERAGKSIIGEVSLVLRQENGQLQFTLGDDGAGLNMARLKQRALESGLLQPGQEISEGQAIQMIFMPGVSTAQEVTEICGRGIGLDVVRSEVAALGGRLDVASVPGRGLDFTITLPADRPAL